MADATQIRFLDCTLNLRDWTLVRAGVHQRMEPQILDLIRFFAENPGRLLSRDDLIEGVWGGRVVSDAAIDSRISVARAALGDSGKRQEIIKTVPRRGYRFLPEVSADTAATKSVSGKSEPDGGAVAGLALPERPSIVVRPFAALGDDPDIGQLALGLRIDIQNALTRLPGIFIVAAGAAAATGDRPASAAGQQLGVRYALEGQVNSAGVRGRVSTQLLDTISGEIIWADQLDFEIEDTFEVLDELTAKILLALDVKLSGGETAAAWHKSLKDRTSIEVFYHGLERFFRMENAAMKAAWADFMRIAKRHEGLAIGPTWVALTYWYDFQRGWSPDRDEVRARAGKWAREATGKTDCDGQADTVLSHVLLLDREFDGALEAGNNAVLRRPNCTHANGFFANVLHYCGMDLQALRHIRLAIRHAPMHPPVFDAIHARSLLGAGDVAGAKDEIERLLCKFPDDLAGLLTAGELQHFSDIQVSCDIAKRVLEIEPEFTVAGYLDGQPYRNAERIEELRNRMICLGLPAS